MRFRELIFDLYGTLVDIHTEETQAVWEKTALYFGFYGASYTAQELQDAFRAAMRRREIDAGQSYECFPDIPIEQVLAQLFRDKGVTENADALGFAAAQLHRISSMEHIRLYPFVREALHELRAQGHRLWLLSNAQRTFTAYEMRLLRLDDVFDGVYISSDYGCQKPDSRFLRALLDEHGLQAADCLMIGNDRATDIAGARALGLATLYLHTSITPPGQAPADPALAPSELRAVCPQWEWEGSDWQALCQKLKTFG